MTEPQDHALSQEVDTSPDFAEAVVFSDAGAPTPRRVEDFISAKSFVPEPGWIRRHILTAEPGTHVQLARFLGIAVSSERTQNTYEGKPLESVKLVAKTKFEATNFITGEILVASVCYLPKSYATQIEKALQANPGAQALLDLTVGIQATGKTIPYRWTVTTYMNEPDPELDALRARRPALPSIADQRQLMLGNVRTIDGHVANGLAN